jgi:glycosyltransferase involved in cell wall biosynthesis
MKIAVAGSRGFPGVQGGVEKHCEKLYTHLAERGCSITVFTRRPYINPDLHIFKNVLLIPIDCPKSKYLEAFVHTFKSILYVIKQKPDILHLHAVGPSVFAVFARAFGIKVVVTNHGPDYERKKWPPPARIFLKFCELMGAIFANRVIAIADNISEALKRKYGIDAAVIPNGVEIPRMAETYDMLKQLGIEKKKYILSVGRLVPEKGFDGLLDAFNWLQNTCPGSEIEKWKLVIIGRADHEDKYSFDLKKKAGKNSNVFLTGYLTGQPLHELYSHAGLFVIPSYYEGLPIVLLEAMSYGLSCIASDIPANRNIMLDERRYFETGNAKSIADKINEFISTPWNEEDSSVQINMISDRYDWEKIAEKTLDIYKHII